MKSTVIPMPVSQHREGWMALLVVLAWVAFVFFSFFSRLNQTFPYWGLLLDPSRYPLASLDQMLSVWAGSLKAILVTVLIWGATPSTGKRVREVLGFSVSNAWLRWGFDMGLGVLALDTFWLGTGFNGLWFAPLWWVLAGLLILLWAWDLFVLFKRGFQGLPELSPFWGYRFLLGMGLVYVLLALLTDLTPETFYDSMVYHLAVPQYWLAHHGLADLPTNFFSNYPYGAELYFMNGLLFQGTQAAKMLHITAWVMAAVFAGGWAEEVTSGKAGTLALGLILTLPIFSLNVWTTQVEGFLALAVVIAIYSLIRWIRTQDPLWAVATGLFAGFAFAIKYNGVIAIGCALVVAAFQAVNFYRKENWRNWAWFLLAFFVIAGPWLIKNGVFTGNPFFPYFSSLFHGRNLSPEGYERLLAEQQGRMTSAWWDWFLLPWKIVMSNPDSYSFAGPVALMLLPFLLLFRFKHPMLRFLVWTAGLVFVVSLAVTHILRFMVPDFVLYYVLLSAVLAGGDRPFWGKASAWMAGFCALLCVGYLADIIHYYYDFSGILSGRQTISQYLGDSKRLTSYYGLSQWLSAHLPEEKRLLIVGDARGLYYTQPFLTNTVFDTQVLAQAAKESKDAEGIAQRLRELGVDYLVVNGLEGIRVSADYHHYDLTRDEWKRLDEFIQRGTELVYSQNLQAVYGLLPKFKAKPKEESLDLLLFFSAPASHFMTSLQKGDKKEAEAQLKAATELYSFSSFWKKQRAVFERELGPAL